MVHEGAVFESDSASAGPRRPLESGVQLRNTTALARATTLSPVRRGRAQASLSLEREAGASHLGSAPAPGQSAWGRAAAWHLRQSWSRPLTSWKQRHLWRRSQPSAPSHCLQAACPAARCLENSFIKRATPWGSLILVSPSQQPAGATCHSLRGKGEGVGGGSPLTAESPTEASRPPGSEDPVPARKDWEPAPYHTNSRAWCPLEQTPLL